jgi:hypothetical protein
MTKDCNLGNTMIKREVLPMELNKKTAVSGM